MKVALDPIILSEEIEVELAKEIETYFREVLFAPLLDLFDFERSNSTEDWEPFPSVLGSLGLSRSQMPQIESGDRGALVQFLKGRGVTHRRAEVLPSELKPTQESFSPVRVERAREHQGGNRAILVSSSGRIIDGHHQWYAALLDNPGEKIEAIFFAAGVPLLLQLIDDFPSVVRDNEVRHPNLDQGLFSGRVSYANGVFSGNFSAEISRDLRELGARFDLRTKTYRLALDKTPYSLRGAIAFSGERSDKIHRALKANLAAISENVAVGKTLGFNVEAIALKMLSDLDRQFSSSLKKAESEVTALEQVTVPPDFTEGMKRDVAAKLTESLALPIKDFTEDQTVKLRQLVEENWNLGGRIDRMEDIIRERFAVSQRKAKFLAGQETTMVASEFARARAQEIGSTEYIWVTRRDDNVRLDHKILNGTVQLWDDPPVADRKRDVHANPGMVWGCLPGDAQINIAHRIKRAFRRYYIGDLTEVILDGDRRLRATPNHPVLTLRGWKPIGCLDETDYVFHMPFQGINPGDKEFNRNYGVTTLREIFGSLQETSIGRTLQSSRDDFHGDGTNGQVDIVSATRFLWIDRKTFIAKCLLNHRLAGAPTFAASIGAFLVKFIPPFPRLCFDSGMGSLGEPLAVLEAHFSHPNKIRLRLGSDRYAVLNENTADRPSANSGSNADRQLALSGNISFNDWRGFGVSLIPSGMGLRNRDSNSLQMTRNAIRTKADTVGHILECHSFGQKALRVGQVRREKFSGHVYNLETATGWYGVDGLLLHNCRCTARTILNLQARRVA